MTSLEFVIDDIIEILISDFLINYQVEVITGEYRKVSLFEVYYNFLELKKQKIFDVVGEGYKTMEIYFFCSKLI
jgi:hypothetical protein